MSYCLTCLKTKKMAFYGAPAGTWWEIMDGEGKKGINSSRSCNSYFLFFKQCASPFELYFRKGLAYNAVSVFERI